jgi:hypothetical protein
VPQALFAFRSGALTFDPKQLYAVTKDGARFLVIGRPVQEASVQPLTVILNWPATIQK